MPKHQIFNRKIGSMNDLIESINSDAIKQRQKYLGNKTSNQKDISSFELSKQSPFFGYVDVVADNCDPFLMFSNNDDFVAMDYFWFGHDAYERMSVKIWKRLASRSSVTFDIGAYTGIYSLCAASSNRKGKIYSFEAIDMIYSRLLINKLVNKFGGLNVYNMAVSDSCGSIEFNVYAGDAVLSTGSSLIERKAGGSGREVYVRKKVNATTIDDFTREQKLSKVDLMKMDAEGAEHLIFHGGAETILKYKPDILCEVLSGSQNEDIEKTLKGMGYNFFKIDDNNLSITQTDSLLPAENMYTLNNLITQKSESELLKLLTVQ